jgi:hypothetical protein
MVFDLPKCLEVLERTPAVLEAMLGGLSPDWTHHNEGGDTWSPYDVIGHLIHGERTDWMARLEIILGDGPDRRFVSFDRFAQFAESRGKTLADLLREFRDIRMRNVARVRALGLGPADLDRTGIHPKFGSVTLRQLLATWTVHDLDHVMQISRVMAKQIGPDTGPWVEYLRIIRETTAP